MTVVTELKSTFSLHIIAAFASFCLLSGAAFYSGGWNRGAIIGGVVCAAIAYLTKNKTV